MKAGLYHLWNPAAKTTEFSLKPLIQPGWASKFQEGGESSRPPETSIIYKIWGARLCKGFCGLC